MKRERIEDLGRLNVMLKNLMDDEIFTKYADIRPKDFPEWFSCKEEDKKWEILNHLAYSVRDLREKLCEMWEITEGDEE